MIASGLRRFLPSFNGNGLEQRADATTMILDRFENEALGIAVAPEDLAVVESCSGIWERSIASASIEPTGGSALSALSPQVLALAGRGLALFGQAVFLIEIDEQGLTLTPSSSWDVQGGVLERDWIYRLDMAAPSGSRTVTRPAESVLHFRIGADARAPWSAVDRLSVEARLRRISQRRSKPS